jgi:hypothetical protein
MKINPKVTGALAWAGLVLVLAVPSAEMLVGKPAAKANLTSDTDPVQTASIRKVVEPAAATGDPVQDFARSGRKMPAYISDDSAREVASVPVRKPGTITVKPDGTIEKPATAIPVQTVTVAPIETATIDPTVVAPTPLPATARPRPLPAGEAPLILDENDVATASSYRRPLVDIVPGGQVVTGDELEEWDSGSLADYLERRGLISESSQAEGPGGYDPDGFFLSDGPNKGRRSRAIVVNDDALF